MKEFKRCFKFLLPIGLGAVVGLIAGFLGVKSLLELLPFAVVCLFAGLMIGSFPAVAVEVKGAKITPLRVALFALGVMIPVAIGAFSAWQVSMTPMPISNSSVGEDNAFASISWRYLWCLPVGYLLAVTQIVPGLSASALLMSLGWFNDLMNSVSLSFWLENPIVFLAYISLGVGFLSGLFTFSKVLTWLFARARHTSYSMIVGLSLGSILSMFFNADILLVYAEWQANGVPALELCLGLGLLVVGVVLSYALVRYELAKTNAEARKNDD